MAYYKIIELRDEFNEQTEAALKVIEKSPVNWQTILRAKKLLLAIKGNEKLPQIYDRIKKHLFFLTDTCDLRKG